MATRRWTTDDWATPWWIVRHLEAEFRPFVLDVCARQSTRKAKGYYGYDNGCDGLAMPWVSRVWCNPPYSDPEPWCRRAVACALGTAEKAAGTLFEHAVLLLSAGGTDTAWFHETVLQYAEIRFVRGRVAFLDRRGRPSANNRGTNLAAIFRRDLPLKYRGLIGPAIVVPGRAVR